MDNDGEVCLNMHMKVPPINNTPAKVKQEPELILTNSFTFQGRKCRYF